MLFCSDYDIIKLIFCETFKQKDPSIRECSIGSSVDPKGQFSMVPFFDSKGDLYEAFLFKRKSQTVSDG